MSSEGESSAKTTPRFGSTLSTSTDDVVDAPPLEKLPSIDQLDRTFEPIDNIGEEYKDPIKLHKMLIDERIKSQNKQTDFETLMEEYNRLDVHLASSKQVEFADKELTQAEKDEINQLKKDLHSTRLQLDDLQFNRANSPLFPEIQQTPFFEPECPPAELEMVRATVIHENKHKHNLDRLGALEDEIEKYRVMYNDIRSKFTILSADFDHQKLEHRDEMDSVRFETNVRVRDAEREKDEFKKQHGELKKYANQQIDAMKNELVRMREKINSYKIEKENLEQSKIQSLKDTDVAMKEASMRAVEAENNLKISKLEIDRITDLLSSRTAECEGLREEIKDLKNDLEETKRQTKQVAHAQTEEKVKFENDREILRLEFGKQINELKVELEKFKSAYRKANVQLESIRRNADKRGQMAENAEKFANEKIEDIKREQWSVIEKIKSEKRETDSLLQKEMEQKLKVSAEFELFREENKSEKNDWERNKMRLENQLNTFRDERVKLNADLSEARIRNEQVEELKRTIETDQRDKNDLSRQLNERDVNQRESILERDSLKVEISNLRRELKMSLEEAKRNREEERIAQLEEKNRLSQRIDQLDIKNQHLTEKLAKSDKDYDTVKKKYNNRMKGVNEENLILKAEKDRIKAELDLVRQTSGVSKDEHDRVKKRMVAMQRRMQQFAQAMYQSDVNLVSPSMSTLEFGLSPRKTRSNQSLITPVSEIQNLPSEITLLNKRLDQMELDQIKQHQVFDKKRSGTDI